MLPWEGAGCLRFRGRVRGRTLRCEAGNDLYVDKVRQDICNKAHIYCHFGSSSSRNKKI